MSLIHSSSILAAIATLFFLALASLAMRHPRDLERDERRRRMEYLRDEPLEVRMMRNRIIKHTKLDITEIRRCGGNWEARIGDSWFLTSYLLAGSGKTPEGDAQ